MSKTVFRTTSGRDGQGTVVTFAAGETIFSEGDTGEEMFILQSGKVEVLKLIGGRERRLAVLEKGDFFGEMALLEEEPRNATIRALEDVTALSVSAATFDQMLLDNPEIVVRMLRRMSHRLRLVEEELDRVASEVPGAPSAEEVAGRAPTSRRKAPGVHRLVSEDGKVEFRLSIGSETTLGRRDPVTGVDPDIDLSPVDGHRSISRAHAKIYHRGTKFFLREEIGTSNGTFVNDERLETGVPAGLEDGDRIQLGLVKLIFRVGE